MDRETQEGLTHRWLTPEALVDFVQALRQDGYHIGVAELIAAQDLIFLLMARGENLDNPERMARLLGPLLCRTPAEQERFPRQFIQWAEQQYISPEQIQAPPESLQETLNKISRRSLRWEWALFLAVVLILTLATANWVLVYTWPYGLPFADLLPLPRIEEVVTLPDIVSLVLGLLFFAAVAWWAWWQIIARQFLARRTSDSIPDLQSISIPTCPDSIYPPTSFFKLARLFRQRVETISSELDVVKTIEQSVARGGWVIPAYARLQVPPEYLVLIDRRSGDDHLAQFVEGLVSRLKEYGVFITVYTFDGDSRVCFPVKGKATPQPLSELAAHYENMRLLVFCETDTLLNAESRPLDSWAHSFYRWNQRAVVTPEPCEAWGTREQQVSNQFMVLPMTPEGLGTFLLTLTGQVRPSEPDGQANGSLPHSLRDHPQRWLDSNALPTDQVNACVSELRAYLGEAGYLWLTACAVYPEVHWPITIYLGETLRDDAGIPLIEPRRLVDLARLPWFRHGHIPDWLRRRLMADLSRDQEVEVRAVLEALLVTSIRGQGEARNLEIARQHREWTEHLAHALLGLLRGRVPPSSPWREQVFQDFMLHHLNLARAKETLHKRLFTKTNDQPGWKTLSQWLGLNLFAVVAILVMYYAVQWDTSKVPPFWFIIIWCGATGLVQWWFLRRFFRLNGWLWAASSIIAPLVFIPLGSSSAQPHFYYYPYGLLSLGVTGALQTGLWSRSHVPSARIWFVTCAVVGILNTAGEMLTLALTANPLPMISYAALTLGGNLIFSLATGWVLLTWVQRQDWRSDRLTWILTNAVSFFLGLIIALLVTIPIPSGWSNIEGLVGFTVWLMPVFFGQAMQLHTLSLALRDRWFWISSLCALVTTIVYMWGHASGWITDGAIHYGILVGIFMGIAQSLVWRSRGLSPFPLLTWLLCTTLGLTVSYGSIDLLSPSGPLTSGPVTMDVAFLLITFFFFPYGIVTSLPLPSLVRQALQRQQSEWAQQVIAHLAHVDLPSRAMAVYLKSHWVPIRFKKLRQGDSSHTDGGILLNAHTFPAHTSPEDPYLLCRVALETKRLQQGWYKSHSILGLLEAWQAGFSVYRTLTGSSYHPVIAKLLKLPQDYSRENLQTAKSLMLELDGPHSQIRHLPLYPWPQELVCRLTRRQPHSYTEDAMAPAE